MDPHLFELLDPDPDPNPYAGVKWENGVMG
jgi:hypothetical protein